ncbi:class I SAM-dependent methyltransferase [Microbacterium hydrocarbonoxydans]|uniref:class I SAM-dependent methyltransferase n=1 Tax=Microbacterium hydrocarbonoxydans TaxID=273678 RepID=UPI003D964CF3
MRLLASSGDRLDEVRAAYEASHAEYLATTPVEVTGAMKEWMDCTLRGVPVNARILEVGSGSGRDADYFESLGYRVQRTDVVHHFIERLRGQGKDAEYLDAVRDDFPDDLDVIFANAVVCHFEKPQFSLFLARARAALNPGGVLSFSTKLGTEYEPTSRQSRLPATRKFSRWPTEELVRFLDDHDFDVEWLTVSGGIRSTSQWINVVAMRRRAIYEI